MSNKFLIFLLGLFLSIIPDIFLLNEYFNESQKCVLRVLILMIFLWITEVIPTPITALIPILAIPVIPDAELKKVLSSYSSSVVFLILGGFIIAQGFEKVIFTRELHLVFCINLVTQE